MDEDMRGTSCCCWQCKAGFHTFFCTFFFFFFSFVSRISLTRLSSLSCLLLLTAKMGSSSFLPNFFSSS